MIQGVEQARRDLLEIYRAGVDAVAGGPVVEAFLRRTPPVGEVSVIAVGKAAQAMAEGARRALGDHLRDALVITKQGYLDRYRLAEGMQGIESAHPVPDLSSLEAGRHLLDYIDTRPEGRELLFLISGGASSLVEVPREGVGLEDLQRLNRWLLASGLPISTINRLRTRLSRIKGGGLLAGLGGRAASALLISDVQGDDPALIGSGLLVPTPDDHALPGGLPEWVRHLCSTQKEHPPGAAPLVDQHLVATLDQAREAAAQRARELGYPTTLHRAFICADAENSGRRLALELLDLPPGVSIWGGEPTVRLPPEPGRGGRAQHLALAAAQVIEGSRDLCFLSAATDGSDGPGEDAGGLVDGQSIARGAREGLEPDNALAHADAGRFLESSGDLITTGPTGTNVMDLMIGLKWDLGGRDEHQGF
ncbi:MAG: DUF4147 domain-containing protein [Candidatus Sedimenticola endophacoides]